MNQHPTMRLGLSGALLALSSLAVINCGDDDSSSPDARRPPDASQALDATRPADASRPTDGGGATDGGNTTDGGGASDASVANCDPAMDQHEPNDTAETAPVVPPRTTSSEPAWVFGDWSIEACRGGSNEDWYRINASEIQWGEGEDYEGSAYLKLRMIIAGSSLCANDPSCEVDRLPDAPENTVTVSVYRASDKTLLTTGSETDGLLKINGRNESFDEDLLVSVSGPLQALYGYQLRVFLDVSNSEDECEC